MADENVAVVRAAVEAFSRGDYQAALEMLDPDIEWVYTYGPEAGEVRGRDAVARSVASWLAMWDSYELIVEEYLPAGDKVVACCRQRGEGKGSGITAEDELFQVWTVRGDKPVRMVQYETRDAALQAAGLAEHRG